MQKHIFSQFKIKKNRHYVSVKHSNESAECSDFSLCRTCLQAWNGPCFLCGNLEGKILNHWAIWLFALRQTEATCNLTTMQYSKFNLCTHKWSDGLNTKALKIWLESVFRLSHYSSMEASVLVPQTLALHLSILTKINSTDGIPQNITLYKAAKANAT